MRELRQTHFVIVILLIGLAARGLEAQEAPGALPASVPVPLTLPDAIRIALERNPALAAVRAEAEASGADREAAASSRWPRLTAEAGWHRTNGQVAVFSDKLTAAEFTAADFAIDSLNHPEALSHGSAALVLEAPLFTSGRIRSAIEAADEASGASRARLRGATDDLVAEVTQVYDGVLLAEASVEVAGSAVESASAHERIAAARFENGAALKSDVLRARVHRLERERDLERKKADLGIARARLRTLLRSAPEEGLVLADSALEAPAEPPGELEDWIAAAATGRPEIEAARRLSAATAAQGRAESAARGPEIAGTALYERHANGLDEGSGSYFAGVRIRWTAFDRGRSARIEAARARAAAAEAWSHTSEDRASLEIEQAWRDAEVANRNLGTVRQAVDSAQEARRITAERYAAGLLPLTDLLDAETALLQASLAEIGARFDAVASRVRLERATGRIEVPR